MKRKSTIGIGLLITLLMITSVFTAGTTIANGDPPEERLEVEKQVYNGEYWDESIEASVGDTVQFKLTVTYHNITGDGFHDHVDHIVVKDNLPTGLTYIETQQPETPVPQINENLITWDFNGYTLYDSETISIIFNASVIGYGQKTNVVNVTAVEHCCNQTIYGNEDCATVNVNPSVDVDKKVWDPIALEWVDSLDEVHLGNLLRFQIMVTYHGNDTMKCLAVTDVLPECCLEYKNNVEFTYPHQGFGSPVTTINGNEITWDWGTVAFNLFNGETITIEFDTNVSEYCGYWVENWAYAVLSGCCDPLSDDDSVSINCVQPQTKFEKKVSNGTTWAEETTAVVGDYVYFQLKLTYYGESKNVTIEVVDYLPCSLEYVVANPEETNVSADMKTVWWNHTTHLNDSDTVEILLAAKVVDAVCCEEENLAELTLTLCGEDPEFYQDTATVHVADNTPPGYPILYEDTEGTVNEILSFRATAYDDEGDQVYYMFDWDGQMSLWLGPYTQGVEQVFTHSWSAAGTYHVKAKSKDNHDLESISWSNIITVVITSEAPQPGDNITITAIKGGLNKVTATIKNNGTENTVVNWTIQIEGKISFLKRKNVETNGNMTLNAGASTDVVGAGQAKRIGFGRVTITVIADAEEYGYDMMEMNGFVLGPLVIIR